MNALKLVLVGDAKVGKTWLLLRGQELYATLYDGYSLLTKPFDPATLYTPTAFETCFTNVDTTALGNYQTNIWDTGGCAFFNFARPLAYICADVFMLCFDLTSRESFNSITKRWMPELRNYQPKTPVLIIGTKSDQRDEYESSGSGDFVSLEEAQNAAKDMGCLYQETSAKTGDLVPNVFEAAVQLGHTKRQEEAWQLQREKVINNGFDPTWIPSAKPPPELETEPSTYTHDLRKVLHDTRNADLLFEFEDGSQSITAHKIVLWLTPSVFKDVLQETTTSNCEKFKELFEVFEFCEDSRPSMLEYDFDGYKTCPQMKTAIVFRNWISRETFTKVLEFLYTGEAGISRDTEQDKIKELVTASKKLKVQSLEDICNYFLKVADSKKDDDQQKSQALNSGSKKLQKPTPSPWSVQNLFLNKDTTLFSDITFLLGDNLVYAHKVILVGRSPVFAALLSDNFREGSSSQVHLQGIDCQSFLAVLEYLYTDYCTALEKIPVENVLILADQLCLSRLVQICEKSMCKDLQEVAMQTSLALGNEFVDHTRKYLQEVTGKVSLPLVNDFVDVLSLAKMYNANQLSMWCLYFVAANHTRFCGKSKELDSIIKENKEFFKQHCWPPKDYLQALEEYRQRGKGITPLARRLGRKKRSCLPRVKCRLM